jgi:hypothetical protein
VICQLPRVAERLLAMMWLLAESWGRVTPAGVTLPLMLTHEALGALIGARRPTVSLALAELVQRGAVVRQDGGWLLLEGFPESAPPTAPAEAPMLLEPGSSAWSPPPSPPPPDPLESLGTELFETVRRLHEHVRRAQLQNAGALAAARSNRERIRARRAEQAVIRRRPASSE